MANISKKELKELRDTELEILKEVVDFCDKNNITYFLAFGSLLGSIRHKGFIPWDDDIDIGMLRSDYEKFLSLFPHDANSKYYVQALEYDNNYWNSFAKVRKSHTLVIEERIKDLNFNKEINLDIFPFDTVNGSSYQDIKIRAILIRIIRDSIYIKKHVNKLSDCHHKILTKLFLGLSVKRLYKIQKWLMVKDKNKNNSKVVNFLSTYLIEKEYTDLETLLPVKKGEFEGLEFNIPNKPEVYLKNLYGNYMELPPLEKQVAHGIIKVDTKKGEYDE